MENRLRCMSPSTSLEIGQDDTVTYLIRCMQKVTILKANVYVTFLQMTHRHEHTHTHTHTCTHRHTHARTHARTHTTPHMYITHAHHTHTTTIAVTLMRETRAQNVSTASKQQIVAKAHSNSNRCLKRCALPLWFTA